MEKGLEPEANGIKIAEAKEFSPAHHFTILSDRNQVEDKDGNTHVVFNFKAAVESLAHWLHEEHHPKNLEPRFTDADIARAKIQAWHDVMGNHAIIANEAKIQKETCTGCNKKGE